jgi:hypothetical protein
MRNSNGTLAGGDLYSVLSQLKKEDHSWIQFTQKFIPKRIQKAVQ